MYRFTITLTDGTVKTVEADSFSGAVASLLPGDPSDIVSVVRMPSAPTRCAAVGMSEEQIEARIAEHEDFDDHFVVPSDDVRALLRQLPAPGAEPIAYGLKGMVTGRWEGGVVISPENADQYDKDALQPFYPSPAPAPLPEGMVLVPREPTIDMVEFGSSEVMKGQDFERAKNCWRAMLAASPGVQDRS